MNTENQFDLERLRKALEENPTVGSIVRLLLLADKRKLEIIYNFVLHLV